MLSKLDGISSTQAVAPARRALAFLEELPRQPGDAKTRSDAFELTADALAGANQMLDAAKCLERVAGGV